MYKEVLQVKTSHMIFLMFNRPAKNYMLNIFSHPGMQIKTNPIVTEDAE